VEGLLECSHRSVDDPTIIEKRKPPRAATAESRVTRSRWREGWVVIGTVPALVCL
jgi:hypothetical protein